MAFDLTMLREMGPDEIGNLPDGDARVLFCLMRWPDTVGRPVCPKCGADAPYEIRSRGTWKCHRCYHQFSPTSGTIFNSRKRSLQEMMKLVAAILQEKNVHQAAIKCGVDYRWAHETANRVRTYLAWGKE